MAKRKIFLTQTLLKSWATAIKTARDAMTKTSDSIINVQKFLPEDQQGNVIAALHKGSEADKATIAALRNKIRTRLHEKLGQTEDGTFRLSDTRFLAFITSYAFVSLWPEIESDAKVDDFVEEEDEEDGEVEEVVEVENEAAEV